MPSLKKKQNKIEKSMFFSFRHFFFIFWDFQSSLNLFSIRCVSCLSLWIIHWFSLNVYQLFIDYRLLWKHILNFVNAVFAFENVVIVLKTCCHCSKISHCFSIFWVFQSCFFWKHILKILNVVIVHYLFNETF